MIVGGEDEDTCNPDRRDELVAQKSGTIAAKAGNVLGTPPLAIDKAWSATALTDKPDPDADCFDPYRFSA